MITKLCMINMVGDGNEVYGYEGVVCKIGYCLFFKFCGVAFYVECVLHFLSWFMIQTKFQILIVLYCYCFHNKI